MWYGHFGQLDTDVPFYVFCAVAGVVTILSVINMFVGCCARGASPGHSMDFYISLGSLLLSFTVLVRGVNTKWADQDELDILCQLFPACLLVGLTMVIGGLLVKGWAIFTYYRWHNGHKLPITEEWKPNLWMWLLLIIVGIVSVVWSALFDNNTKIDTVETTVDRVVMVCKWDNEFEWQVATSVLHAFLLLLAFCSVLANACGNKDGCRMASPTSVVTINTLGAVVAGVVVHFVQETPTVYYGITGGLMLWVCLFANIVFMASRLCKRSQNPEHEALDDENYDTIKTESSLGGRMGNDNALMLQERNKNTPGRPGEVFNY